MAHIECFELGETSKGLRKFVEIIVVEVHKAEGSQIGERWRETVDLIVLYVESAEIREFSNLRGKNNETIADGRDFGQFCESAKTHWEEGQIVVRTIEFFEFDEIADFIREFRESMVDCVEFHDCMMEFSFGEEIGETIE